MQNLLTVWLISSGAGEERLAHLFELVGGASDYNLVRARKLLATAGSLQFTHR
ncbi:MAG: hypothetical protein KBS55_03975 [Bacteroidales bacterium]|nr:hypothetical protein [Candidatus Cryptobacteroides aphodequi]